MLNRLCHIAIVMFLSISTLSAQEECTFTLSRAQRLYDAGKIEEIPQMLKTCMENGFTAEEKQQAQKLIILSYLFDNNNIEADRSMLEFLKKYPEYELNTSDQAEFVQLFNSYLTLPIVSVGIIGGINYSSIDPSKGRGVNNSEGSYSSSSPGFHAGISTRIYLINKLDLNVEVFYMQSMIKYQNENLPGDNKLSFEEKRSSLSLPISIIYTPMQFNKINPYIRAGFSFDYLFNSTANLVRENQWLSKPFTGSDISVMYNRNKVQFQAVGALGITYKLKHSFLMFEIRYNQGFMNQTKNNVLLNAENQDFWALYYSEENNYKYSPFSVNIGLLYKIYKPRKK